LALDHPPQGPELVGSLLGRPHDHGGQLLGAAAMNREWGEIIECGYLIATASAFAGLLAVILFACAVFS
jgi:hypothetical protein